MKVYVDELPKSCENCPCYSYSEGFCSCEYWWQKYKEIKDVQEFTHLGYKQNERPTDCPIQSLADHDKQVRKEVCEEIRKSSPRNYEAIDDMYYCVSASILDQIQGDVK